MLGVTVKFGIGSHSRDGALVLWKSGWNERNQEENV